MNDNDRISQAAERIQRALGSNGRLTVLTGAGISQESGIPTFRDQGGLWERFPLEEVATPEAFARNPQRVLEFYNLRRRALREVKPNPAHFALAELERLLGDRFTLITQNIDDLHERAGSRRVLHMHGELLKARCLGGGHVLDRPDDIRLEDRCPECGARLRPHVVWFGEIPLYLETEIPRALDAEVFLSAGTSGTVYPAAGFVVTARARGALTVEVNLEPGEQAALFDLNLYGRAGEILPRLVRALTGGSQDGTGGCGRDRSPAGEATALEAGGGREGPASGRRPDGEAHTPEGGRKGGQGAQ